MTAEDGQISIIRSLVLLALVGVVLFEGGSVVITRFQAGDVASQAASEAGIEYIDKRSEDAAEVEAKTYVAANHAEFVDMTIDQGARTISVRVKKTARTLFIHRIDALKGMTAIDVTESAPLR